MKTLPHQSNRYFMAWTGMETDLIFNHGIDLPGFASFPLLERSETRQMLAAYAKDQIALARKYGCGAILESATWMANADRAADLGYSPRDLERVNRDAIALLASLVGGSDDVRVSANIGPRNDAYLAGETMTAAEAEEYHDAQIQTLVGTAVDMISPYTFSNAAEAIGVVNATRRVNIPCVVALTVETDGSLPSGQAIGDAVAEIDNATDSAAAYFMINCAHPDHFANRLPETDRLRGIVVNASRCSHAELDEATALDDGNPEELGQQVAEILRGSPSIRVFGGCCGTDMRHLEAMARALGEVP